MAKMFMVEKQEDLNKLIPRTSMIDNCVKSDKFSWRKKFIKKIGILKEKCLMFIQSIFSHIFYLILKKKTENDSKIVAGFHDLYYNGNPRAVFEYMRRFPNKYKCFWVANNRCSYQSVKKDGGRVYYMNSIRGIPQFLRADVWIIAHASIRDIPSLPHKNYKIVQLWHGAGSSKGTF